MVKGMTKQCPQGYDEKCWESASEWQRSQNGIYMGPRGPGTRLVEPGLVEPGAVEPDVVEPGAVFETSFDSYNNI